MNQIIAAFIVACVFLLANGSNTEENLGGDDTRSKAAVIIFDMNNLRENTLKTLTDLWSHLNESNDVNYPAATDLTLLQVFQNISRNISQMETNSNTWQYYLVVLDESFNAIEKEIVNINKHYESFLRFQEDNLTQDRKWPTVACTNLAETYLQKSNFGIMQSLENIHAFQRTFRGRSNSMFENIEKDVNSNRCMLRESPHQVIYNLYNSLTLTQLKGIVLVQFSYMLLELNKKGKFTAQAQMEQIEYEKRSSEQDENVRNILSKTDRGYYRCDPKNHVEGVTYEKLTKLVQGYIENEVNLNPYGTCGENCAFYEYTEYNGCFKQQFCAHQPACLGKVVKCRFVDSDMNICRSSNTNRRYDWVQYKNGEVLGRKGVCENINLHQVDSWWRYLFWHCSYCLCLCDDSYESDRYFNLRDVTADVHENKVVTGVRMIKNNNIIHMQIQQGVLGPRGAVEKETISWKPVDNYTIDDQDVESNVDYHTMSWLERTIDIDDAQGQVGQAVTGVRFRKLGSHLNLEVRITPIDFITGKISKQELSYWQGNDNTDANFNNPRSEIILLDPDIPIRRGPHRLNSKHDQFIQFQATSFKADVAQNTVPFIDSQSVTSRGFLISGIGLIHRGQSSSGGFIAPKLITYDFTQHVTGAPKKES